MTIQFNCPNCGALIAFPDKHGGKRAQCTACEQKFVIPLEADEKPKKIEPPKEKAEPLSGFYRAVFVDSRELFTTAENVTGLVFIMTAVCLKFFVARCNYLILIPGRSLTMEIPLPIGLILSTAAWGFLFWYYMEIIYSTAFQADKLPEVNVGGCSGLFRRIVRSVYTFFIVLLVVEMPYIVAALILKKMDAESPVLLRVLMLGGLFLFPMAILTAAVGRDLTMLRPDYFLITIYRATRPYLVTAVLLGAAGVLHMHTSQYSGQGFAAAAGHLLLNFGVQALALVAMRSIGLFYRHYGCCLPW